MRNYFKTQKIIWICNLKSKKAEPKAQKPAKKTTKQEVRKQSTSGLKSDIEVQQTDSNIDGSNGMHTFLVLKKCTTY